MSFWDDLSQRYTSSAGGTDWGNLLGDASNLQYKNGYEQDYGALGRAIDAGNRPKTTGTQDEMGPPSPPGSPSFMGPPEDPGQYGSGYQDKLNQAGQSVFGSSVQPPMAPAGPSPMEQQNTGAMQQNIQRAGAEMNKPMDFGKQEQPKIQDNSWMIEVLASLYGA